ncbi:uncharacterized protein LOC128213624 isoform X2 [Mya arenaria]|uniref:uncharacterized protein LOC128213624 isoform X2 n=1 Tax=Mya arenaria TaxID=6604 RepID=UPI0022DEE6C9|nr:uncharacterized protein LOC128213624 isoform X2 [Mya arenaria]
MSKMAAFRWALWSIYTSMWFLISSAMFTTENLKPNSPNVCTNTSLTFTCNDPGNPNASQLLMYNVNDLMIPESELSRGESDVNFTIPNISTADYNANVLCGYFHGNVEDYDVKGLTLIIVYSYPVDLEEIHCEAYDYDEAMTCTWKWGQEYFGKNTPEVTCQFRSPSLSASWTKCNATKSYEGVVLNISSTRQGDFSMKKMEFNMTLKSQCGITTSKVFPVDTSNIVRPAPPYDLKTNVQNSTCIEFVWRQRSANHDKTHRLTVTSEWNDTQVKEFNITHSRISNAQVLINYTICDLHPSTTYTGSIEMLPISGGFWSEESQVKGTTMEDSPSASPEVIGYTWDLLECEKGEHRNVRVFWKPVPEIDKNGEIIYYNVTLWPEKKAEILNEDGIASNFFSVNLPNVLCDMSYRVTVEAYTRIGGSPHNHSFVVLRHSTVERPHFMVESITSNSSDTGTNVTVDIEILGVDVEEMTKSAAHYMICWCEKDRGSCKRMSVLHCVRSQTKTTSLELADPGNKMYAVSMVTESGDTSSLALESCIYPKNIDPTVSPNSVKASPGSEDNTINVIWDKLTCQSWQPFIATYVVQYCIVPREGINDCKSPVDRVEVPESDFSYMLTDLKEDEVYRFVVQGKTRDGKYTPDSEPAFAKAVNKALKPGEITGIVFGCVFFLAFAIAGFVFVARHCNHRRKEFLKSKKEITDIAVSPQNDITCDHYTNFSDSSNVIPDENHALDNGMDNDGYLVPSDMKNSFNEELGKRLERQESKDSGVPMSPDGNNSLPIDYSRARRPGSGSSTPPVVNDLIVNRVQLHNVSPNVFPNEKKLHMPYEKKDGVQDKIRNQKITEAPIALDYSKATVKVDGIANSGYVDNTLPKCLSDSDDGADKTGRARVGDETLRKEVDNGNVDPPKDSGFTEKSFRNLSAIGNQRISFCSDDSLDNYKKATISEEGSQSSMRSLQSKNTSKLRLAIDQKAPICNNDYVPTTENPKVSQTEQDSLSSSHLVSLQSSSLDASDEKIEQIHANILLQENIPISNIPVPTNFDASNSSNSGLSINKENSDSFSQPLQGSSGQEKVADYIFLADQTPQGQGLIEDIVEPIELDDLGQSQDNDQVVTGFNLGQDYIQAQSNVGQGQSNQAYVQAPADQGQDYIQNLPYVDTQANLGQDQGQDYNLNPPNSYVQTPANQGQNQGQDYIQTPPYVKAPADLVHTEDYIKKQAYNQAQANQGQGEDYNTNKPGQRSRQSSGASDSLKSDSGVSSTEESCNSPESEPSQNFRGGYVSENSFQAKKPIMKTSTDEFNGYVQNCNP